MKESNFLMNLPYVKDGDRIVTQSNACMAYLGRRFNLNGSNEEEIARNDQVLCEVFDLRNKAVMFFYSPAEAFTAAAPTYLATRANVHLAKLEGWLLQVGKKFASADTPLTADFHLFEMLDQHLIFGKSQGVDALAEFPTLAAYHKRFLELEPLKGYFAGPMHALPLNNKSASFGATA